jgi:hypothetical protein
VALTNGGAVFMGAAGLALMVLTYMQRD